MGVPISERGSRADDDPNAIIALGRWSTRSMPDALFSFECINAYPRPAAAASPFVVGGRSEGCCGEPCGTAPITKTGNSLLRHVLGEAAQYVPHAS
jgi:hypothetical protein